MGKVGLLFGVRGEVAPHLLDQPRAHLLRAYRAANAADVLLVRELLLAGAGLEEGTIARRLFGELPYRSARLKEELLEAGVLLRSERAERRPAIRQQAEVCFAALKRVFGMGETLATTLVGLATRIAEKVTAYTYGFCTSTGALEGRRGSSRPCGREILATLI